MSSYVNLTNGYVFPAFKSLEKNYNSDKATFFKKELLLRAGHLALLPCSLVTTIADTFIGIGAGFASIITEGHHAPTFYFAMNHLHSSRQIVATPYLNLLKTLNPQAKISFSLRYLEALIDSENLDENLINELEAELDDYQEPAIAADGDGFMTHHLHRKGTKLAKSFCKSKNLLKCHIASRLTYPLLAVSLMISRVADSIIGVLAATISFVTLGKITTINNLAVRALQTPGIIFDLFYCTIRFINPWAGRS